MHGMWNVLNRRVFTGSVCWVVGANCAVRPFAVSLINILYVSSKLESKRCNVQRVVVAVKHAIGQIFTVICVYVCI
jgi:hypothetical protein